LSGLDAADGSTIVLFDIDGTLIRTGRAGNRAMNRAFDDLFGIAGAFDGIEMAGRTDKWILGAAATRAGVDLIGDDFERFRDRYFTRLREALPPAEGSRETADNRETVAAGEGPKGVLPGVQGLLETIHTRTDIFPALLTGNCEDGARIKLEHFDLWRFFRCGAYGDEVVDRNHLFDVALQRAQECGAPRVSASEVIIVGDTVLDVACARAAGARSIAVATGPSDVETLRQSGADMVMRDLSDIDAFLRFIFVQT
jgi:phosphoglycolate phosphatase-like HAD superfamily hydrolase